MRLLCLSVVILRLRHHIQRFYEHSPFWDHLGQQITRASSPLPTVAQNKRKKYHPSITIIHVNPCSSMKTHENPTVFHYNSPYQFMLLIHMLIHQSIDWVPRRCVSLHELFDVCLPNAPWPVESLPWKASTVNCKYPDAMHTIWQHEFKK